jgi:hypothetical protein
MTANLNTPDAAYRPRGATDPVEPNRPPRDLTPAFEAPGTHDFTVRVSIVHLACRLIAHGEQSALRSLARPTLAASTASHPALVTFAKRLCLWERDGTKHEPICAKTQAKSCCKQPAEESLPKIAKTTPCKVECLDRQPSYRDQPNLRPIWYRHVIVMERYWLTDREYAATYERRSGSAKPRTSPTPRGWPRLAETLSAKSSARSTKAKKLTRRASHLHLFMIAASSSPSERIEADPFAAVATAKPERAVRRLRHGNCAMGSASAPGSRSPILFA